MLSYGSYPSIINLLRAWLGWRRLLAGRLLGGNEKILVGQKTSLSGISNFLQDKGGGYPGLLTSIHFTSHELITPHEQEWDNII